MSVTEASRKRECPSLHVSHPASLSASPVPCPLSSLSASPARVTSWFLFIHFTLGFDAAPLWCGVKYLQGFLLWAILGGFMVGSDLPLISFRSILKQETEPGRLSPQRRVVDPSSYFIFISDCMWSDGSFGFKKKKQNKNPKRRKMKGDESKYEEHVCRCGWSERRLTGGTQLANHRGSCDAGVASVMSQQSRKLTLHCPFVPPNRKYTVWQMVHCRNTGSTLTV